MSDSEQQQATLLEQYYVALDADDHAASPPSLDPARALIAASLHRQLRGQPPTAAFRSQLRQRLEAAASTTEAVHRRPFGGRKEEATMPQTTTFAPRPPLSRAFGRFVSLTLVLAFLVGGLAVANDLIRKQQPNLASTPTPPVAALASPAADAPCNGPLGGWQPTAALPGSMGGAVASDGTYLYVAGGPLSLNGPSVSDQLLRYDPAADKWTALTKMPVAVASAVAVYSPVNKKLYVFGGMQGKTNQDGVSLADTHIYDPATDTWSSGASMPEARILMGVGYWNGKIYLVGGLLSLATPSIKDQTWEYDPVANKWATRTARPHPASGFGYGVINGHFYSAGGFDGATNRFSLALYDYDIAADQWTARADLPKAIDYSGSAVVGNRLYLFGGLAGGGLAAQKQSYVYDAASDAWSNGPDMATLRSFGGGASIGNTIYAVAGANGSGLLNSVEAATVSCAAPAPTLLPAPTQHASTDNPYLFTQTGKTIGGLFRAYWEQHGGLDQQGYPISDEFQEVSDLDGKTYTVQYFERAVFEAHPENTAPNNVLLSQLGTFRYKQKYPNGAANQTVSTDHPYKFDQTGHTIGGVFRTYWETHGGLAQQGYPISDQFQEQSATDGKTYTVQYFERAVFELHPENAGTPYEVELSQLGRFRYQQKYPTAP